nr:MAG TPA: hypothetical protein [Caudoviricetes sp.]
MINRTTKSAIEIERKIVMKLLLFVKSLYTM